MTTKSNYFFVNRELLHSDRWLSEPFSRGQAWVDLFGLANHQPGYVRVRGVRIDVGRGQMAWSQLTLANRWHWSRGKVKRYLNELEKNEDIVQQNNKLVSLITICKYDLWQGQDSKSSTTDSTTNGHQTDIKQYTNNKNKEKRINKTIIGSVENDLLLVINRTLKREFRTLPRGYKKTLDLFSIDEIERALSNLSSDAWHHERLPQLKLDYLIRATTIDKFLLEESVQKSENKRMKLNLDTGKMEEVK